ncbi:LuxR C-terminal-related transcriptional regulator [Pedobacter sp. BMA]|uniref:LuxR C-terminal-related transcriptional regulator n=1 Tax=Pedobacter sp. BMA TaxID=1663685 RepID=UPI00069E047F|nr:LuxR C-terminal-related transcriptional regulator [Pedobacter sp. BMA]
MKVKRSKDLTFKNHLQKIYYTKELIEENEITNILNQFNGLNLALNHSAPLLFAIDYTRSDYMIITQNAQLITGYDPRSFLESGIPMLLDIYQKDDFKIYNEQVFTRNAAFLVSQPQSDHHKFIFSYNFRIRHMNGTYIPLYQRGCYITSKETGLPLYSLGMVIDITMFKRDTMMYHSIEKVENENGFPIKTLLEENHYFPLNEDKILSPQELRVLECMAEGYSSKQIAWKMKIAENTVANHRKSMLKKTNTKNVAELIAFACGSHLL